MIFLPILVAPLSAMNVLNMFTGTVTMFLDVILRPVFV
jgi:hypothetical protein